MLTNIFNKIYEALKELLFKKDRLIMIKSLLIFNKNMTYC